MDVGLLWFDDSSRRKLEDKVARAAAHYERKYGRAPNLCLVHPSTFNGNGKKNKVKMAGGVEIRPGRSVLRHHFWVGIVENESGSKTRAKSKSKA